jgi:hypothetical protein
VPKTLAKAAVKLAKTTLTCTVVVDPDFQFVGDVTYVFTATVTSCQ